MAVAKADAMVQHCLPAHREEEITEKVFEAHANEIFEEAENRLHAQKAVMVKVMVRRNNSHMTKAVHAGGRLFCVEHIKKVFDVTG